MATDTMPDSTGRPGRSRQGGLDRHRHRLEDGPDDGLHVRYRAYCRAQALHFLGLVPREGIRPLYRATLAWAEGPVAAMDETPGAIDLMIRYCQARLPLPTFEVWLKDRRAHPAAHLDMEVDADGDGFAGGHETVEVRTLESGGRSWYATLSLRHNRGAWGGRIVFHTGHDGRSYRTGEIFREGRADEARSRFMELDDRTLGAFLRSTLP